MTFKIAFERLVSQDYLNQRRKKETEIQQLQKSLLRDSMRIAFFELGQIHYNFGFLSEAIKTWIRSHDFSSSEEDLFNVSFTIAKAAFEHQATPYLAKYAGEADARDKGKVASRSVQVKILDAMSSIALENYREAAIKLTNISITDMQAI